MTKALNSSRSITFYTKPLCAVWTILFATIFGTWHFSARATSTCADGVIDSLTIVTCNFIFGDLTIQNAGSIIPTTPGANAVNSSLSANSLSNLGTITGSIGGVAGTGGAGGTGVTNSGIITIVNNQQISGGSGTSGGTGATGSRGNFVVFPSPGATGGNGGAGGAGILNSNNIGTITNTSVISGAAGGAGGKGGTGGLGGAVAPYKTGGTGGTGGNGGAGGAGILNSNNIGTITNTSVISGAAGGAGGAGGDAGQGHPNGTGGSGGNGSVGGDGIRNSATVTTLTNSGTLSGGTGGAAGNGSGAGGGGLAASAGYGIYNTGTITTLNNSQGVTSTAPLTYTGTLPTNYNIIVNNSSLYGKLAVTGVAGTTTFGISSLSAGSSIVSGTAYASVLSGIPRANLLGGATGLITSISNNYTYTLTESLVTSGTWNLTVSAYSTGGGGSGGGSSESSPSTSSTSTSSTSTSSTSTSTPPTPTNVTSGTSVGLSSIGVTSSPVLDGGTLVLTKGQRSSQTLAVQGTGSTIESPASGVAQLYGVLSGSGKLTFNGSGMTVLSGANTYTGGTSVESGTLSLLGGTLGSGNVYVAPGAQLVGTGSIAGPVTVAGLLKPGNSPGYIGANANVIMTTGSVYQQDIAGTTQSSAFSPVGATGYYSYLNITSGQFIINTGSTLTPALSNLFNTLESGYGSTPYMPVLGDRFRIITADGGISGKFSTVTQSAELTLGTQFLPFYNMAGSNSLDLAVIPKSYIATLSSSNANTRSVSSALDKIVVATQAGASTSTQDQLLYATSAQNSASLPSYVQSLAGEIYAATVAVVSQATLLVHQAVMSRLGDTVSAPMVAGGMNPVVNGVNNIAIAGQAPLANVSSNPSVNPNATVTNAALNNGAAWGEIAYQRGNRSSDDNASGFSSNLYQLVLGVDAYSEHGIKVGGGLALSNTNVTANQGTGTVQQGSLFLYGKLPIDTFVLDGMASYGMNSTDNSRGDVTGLSNGFSSKGVKGNDALLSIGLSRPIELESLRITPYIRATGQRVNQSSFTEGASPAALSVDSFNGNGVRGVLGVALGSKAINPMNESFTYRVNLGVGVDSSNLLNPTLNASLAGMPTAITTPKAGSTFAQAGLYGTVNFAENAYAYAGVSGEFRSGSTLGNVNVGLRIQF